MTPRKIFDYPKYWAECFGTAPFLPMSRAEMDLLGWDRCDIILVTGDAYIDHPSFGMAVIGRTLEAQGFRVGIIAQPNWHSKDDFMRLGKPELYFGVTAGNMDSMINRYTAERKIRSDDAYTPGGMAGKRPDRASLVYTQRCKEAWSEVPVVLGGIEASLRRSAHYDYWQDKVRRSILVDAKADILLYGNAERALIEVSHRLAAGEAITNITDVRGTAFIQRSTPQGWLEIDSTRVDRPGRIDKIINPYVSTQDIEACQLEAYPADTSSDLQDLTLLSPAQAQERQQQEQDRKQLEKLIAGPGRKRSVIRLPSFEKVSQDPVLYAHASRVLHLETNPGNARALVQKHGQQDLWINPPPIPLTTEEMDTVFDQPYARAPHPEYGNAKIPAWDMIRFSVNIMRGCFGGCTFCSITEHEGRIIQNRSQASILREIEAMRDKVAGFTGVVSDLGGPTANMYRLACRSQQIEAACRKPSCVYPGICSNLNTDHTPLIELYQAARELPGIKKVLIASGVRYDLAVEAPKYIQELATHHVGGYLKIAPEHTEEAPLAQMMKPGIATYNRFETLFQKFSQAAGKQQYLIPYFIAAHPGTSDTDMLNLALWLKAKNLRADQVQAFYPSPMASATAMYHTERNPLTKVDYKSPKLFTAKGEKNRRLHKAFLRYHDPKNWPLLRTTLHLMGRSDLIGYGKKYLVPPTDPIKGTAKDARVQQGTTNAKTQAHNTRAKGRLLTQHTGLPPQSSVTGAKNSRNQRRRAKP